MATDHASVQAAAARGVDFYGSWQNNWKATERDVLGRSAAYVSSAFPYDAQQDVFRCPAGEALRPGAILNRGHGLNAGTGQMRFRIPFPTSTSTIDGFRCKDSRRNVLKSVSPSEFGAVLTSDTSRSARVDELATDAAKLTYSFA